MSPPQDIWESLCRSASHDTHRCRSPVGVSGEDLFGCRGARLMPGGHTCDKWWHTTHRGTVANPPAAQCVWGHQRPRNSPRVASSDVARAGRTPRCAGPPRTALETRTAYDGVESVPEPNRALVLTCSHVVDGAWSRRRGRREAVGRLFAGSKNRFRPVSSQRIRSAVLITVCSVAGISTSQLALGISEPASIESPILDRPGCARLLMRGCDAAAHRRHRLGTAKFPVHPPWGPITARVAASWAAAPPSAGAASGVEYRRGQAVGTPVRMPAPDIRLPKRPPASPAVWEVVNRRFPAPRVRRPRGKTC